MSLEYDSSRAGEFVQSLLLERNKPAQPTPWIFSCACFGHFIGDPSLLVEVRNFGVNPQFEFRRRLIPFGESLCRGAWAQVLGTGTTHLLNLPGDGGWHRYYFQFRAVCEAVPTESFSIREDTPFDSAFGSGLGLGKQVGVNSQLSQLIAFQNTYNPTVTWQRVGGQADVVFNPFNGLFMLNRIVGPPTPGLVYFDRIVAVSLFGTGESVFGGTNYTSWANATVGRVFQGGSPEGDYAFNDPALVHGTSWHVGAQTSDNVHFRNSYGHAPDILDPTRNIVSAARLTAAGTPIDLYQFGQVILLGSTQDTTWRPEEIVELTGPEEVTEF